MGLIGLGLLLPLIAGAIGLLLTYWVISAAIKTGVREGISESRIRIPSGSPAPSTAPVAPPGFKWVLVRDDSPQAPAELRID